MTAQTSDHSRRFPNLAWAWPNGARHQLVTAAICPDHDRAYAAIKLWLANTDLDEATFAEHRLLAAITMRFSDRLKQEPEFGRLSGLQRLHWTKSRMAVAAVTPALKEMNNQGLQIILLKGSCRVALDPSEQKARTSYDLDLLLSAQGMSDAFEILAAQGWQSTRGESTMGLRARISTVRARNFKKGKFGDIDLHQNAYHTANAHPELDRKLFIERQPVTYYGFDVFIPSAEERLAMAIGHGGWDGHSHSDWLVDAAGIITREAIDWPKFKAIISGRNLTGATAIALSYLQDCIGLDLPAGTMDAICGRALFRLPRQIPALILARDADDLTRPQQFARKVIENVQKARFSGRDKIVDTTVTRSFVRRPKAPSNAKATFQFPLDTSGISGRGKYCLTVTVEMDAPPVRRRFEFEINDLRRNICNLQAIHWNKKSGKIRANFKVDIEVDAQDFPLTLATLPGKLIESPGTPQERQKYAAVPFSLVRVTFAPM